MLACPVTDPVLVAAWSAIAVGAIAVGLLQELLALEVLFEDDASDLKVRQLISKASFFWRNVA